MTEGRYAKGYRDGEGNLLESRLELLVAKILQVAGVSYRYEVLKLKDGRRSIKGFLTGSGFIKVLKADSKRELYEVKILREAYPDLRMLVVTVPRLVDDVREMGVPYAVIDPDGDLDEVRTQALFIDDPALSFDYSHILPSTEKCSVLHGHTSTVLVEIVGEPRDGMIVDFGAAKSIVKNCLRELDHKLLIFKRYVKEQRRTHYRVAFEGRNGRFDLTVPKRSSFMLDGEATIENLAQEVLRRVARKMPDNVDAVGVYVYEGLNKGSHLVAQLPRKPRKER